MSVPDIVSFVVRLFRIIIRRKLTAEFFTWHSIAMLEISELKAILISRKIFPFKLLKYVIMYVCKEKERL